MEWLDELYDLDADSIQGVTMNYGIVISKVPLSKKI